MSPLLLRELLEDFQEEVFDLFLTFLDGSITLLSLLLVELFELLLMVNRLSIQEMLEGILAVLFVSKPDMEVCSWNDEVHDSIRYVKYQWFALELIPYMVKLLKLSLLLNILLVPLSTWSPSC